MKPTPIPKIDCHHHLWDLKSGRYTWPTHSYSTVAGQFEALNRDYLVQDLLADLADTGVVKSVHIQANAGGSAIPGADLQETRWLQSLADDPRWGGFPHGIVALSQCDSFSCYFFETRWELRHSKSNTFFSRMYE